MIYQEMDPAKDFIQAAKDQGGEIPEISALIDMLVAHKKKRFPADKRIIGVYDIEKKPDGSFSMWAEVHEGGGRLV